MKKEIIIVSIIVFLVIVTDVITQKHTKATIGEVSNELGGICEELDKTEEVNQEDIESRINSTIEKWKEKKKSIEVYIEHAELEKLEMYMLDARSYIKKREYNMAYQALETCDFIANHIMEKYSFCLENLF